MDVSKKNLENTLQAFKEVKALFFDVSDTLYSNEQLEGEYPRVLAQLVADTKGISFEEARDLIKVTTLRLQETESHVTKVRAVRELGITREQAQEYITAIKPHDFLEQDLQLKQLLTDLQGKYILGVISNLNKIHLLDVLNALGLEKDQFSLLVTEDIVEHTKPHPEPFLKAIELSGFAPGQCLFIGDSPSKDMQPAKQQGMQTILVKQAPNEGDMKDADAYIGQVSELEALIVGYHFKNSL